MIVFPNCKINLGLRITGKRTDGFHNIETVFYPVPLLDVLELIPVPETSGARPALAEAQLHTFGLPIAGNPENNLCLKAYQILKKDFPQLPAVDIYLLKQIPMGAGLGGGSANGSFLLKLMNELFQLQIPSDRLLDYALALGSDCPFFVENKPCVAAGRGEILSPLSLSLSGYQIAFVHPGIHVNTGWAFGQLQIKKPPSGNRPLQQIVLGPIETWKQELHNDFEKPVFEEYPQLKELKEDFYRKGAIYAAMSGSGSTVFGIFKKEKTQILPAAARLIDL